MVLDTLNCSILNFLQENARLSFAEIGRQVGLSAPAVAERVQRMEDAEIIKSYRVHLNTDKIGYPLKAIISLKLFSGKLTPFLNRLQELSPVYECHRVTGNCCLIMKVALPSSKGLESLINIFMEYGEPTSYIILSSIIDEKPLEIVF